MIERSEEVPKTILATSRGPLSSEILYVERLIGEQDINSARRILTGLRVAIDKSNLEAAFTKAMIELLDIETRAILGLSIRAKIDKLTPMIPDEFSEVIQSRVHVVEFMELIATRKAHRLAEYVSSHRVDSTLVSLEESYSNSGILDPEIALSVKSPLARTLYQHCLLAEPSVVGTQSDESTNLNRQVAKASLGSKVPPSSMLPVMIWRMELAASKRRWVRGLIDREFGGNDFPTDSYGRLMAKACDAILLTEEGNFAEAKVSLSASFNEVLLDESLLHGVYLAKMKCALGFGDLAEAAAMVESVVRQRPSEMEGSRWTEAQSTSLIDVFRAGVKPSKAGCVTLNRMARNLILNFGEGSYVVQQLRLHASMMALEIGEITECASILADFESALGIMGVDHDALAHSGHQEIAEYLNSLRLWKHGFLEENVTEVADSEDIQDLAGGWYTRSVQDLRNSNEMARNYVSRSEVFIADVVKKDTDSTTLSGSRVNLLVALGKYEDSPSEDSFGQIRRFVHSLDNAFVPGLSDHLLRISEIAAVINLPGLSTEIEDRISKALKSESHSVNTRLSILLGQTAESRRAFRVAAVKYDHLCKNECHWLDSSGSLESYTRYRSAHSWAMNFNYDKAIWRAMDTLRVLDGQLDSAESIRLLDLAARCCEHLGDRTQALDLLGRALTILQPVNEEGARMAASLSLRAGRCAEELSMLDVALNHYRAGVHALVSTTNLEDDDLVVLKLRANFVAIALNIDTPGEGTFDVCKRTLDSP